MPRLFAAVILAAFVLAPATVHGQSPSLQTSRDPADGRLMPPERVADRVWVMRQPDRLWAAVIGNVTIVEQSDGIVLVDSGGSIADGRDIVRAVAELTPKPIKAVAITHWHNDHPLGLPAILEAFPRARVIGTPRTAEFLKTETNVGIGRPDPELDTARRKRGEATVAEFAAIIADPATTSELRAQYRIENQWIARRVQRQAGNYVLLPTELVTNALLLDDVAAPVELRFLGTANTHGDLVAWLPRQQLVVTGDMVVLPTPYGFAVSIAPWLETLAKLEALPFSILVPGHGRVQRDRKYLGTLGWSMRDIAGRAKAAAASGQTKEQAWAAFDRAEQRKRFGAVDAWTRLWLDGYWLEGMFGTAFDEAKGIPAPGK